jgi:3-dehydroquinate dehydratase/shikimate dehydrogenase
MGTVGIASRYLAPLLGPPLSFAAWRDGAAAAPGQLTVAQLEAVIGHLAGPPRRLFGVVGRDVGRSLSPALHCAGYRALDLPDLFIPVSVPDETELIEVFTFLGDTLFDRIGLAAHGWAVTTPYKDIAADAAEMVAPRVRRAFAANTLVLRETGMAADNTDADGIVASLVSLGIDACGRTAVVQGTGGAARGAAVGLYLAGAEVFLRGRDAEVTAEIAEILEISALEPGATPDRARTIHRPSVKPRSRAPRRWSTWSTENPRPPWLREPEPPAFRRPTARPSSRTRPSPSSRRSRPSSPRRK